ncbi:FCD domain-containing protein [Limnohabitans sp.]|jgi:DNA-binding GntR family transcriptional regulator|uniref:GntR family transcriptional regulator n=1 Tax=Limnohabitans sp. TaxID=1907725 RepID=UPI0037BE344F
MSTDKNIPTQVLNLIRQEGLEIGAHLPAQWLADQLKLSRTPINDALAFLHNKGILQRERNRGYFIAKAVDAADPAVRKKLGLTKTDATSQAYFTMADDLLKGELPETVSEVLLRNRYELTAAQLQAVLHRIAQEGWAQKKPGYGWEFSAMLTTPDSLLQSYRLRMALEPAALLEPGYRLDPKVIEQCRAAEQHLLGGGIETDTPDQLHERGVRFHESLIEASGNPFFIDTIRRVNRVRRLISYRSMQDRKRYKEHCQQHLHLLDLLEASRNQEAADIMREHLSRTLKNHQKIRKILKP